MYSNSLLPYLNAMADLSLIADLRKRYVELTRQFFREIDEGKSLNDLHDLQQEIEQLMLKMDSHEQSNTADGSPS